MSSNDVIHNTLFKQLNIFEALPDEILLMVAKKLNPIELSYVLSNSAHFHDFIIPRISTIAKYYNATMSTDVERFMWGFFDNEFFNLTKEQLFNKMAKVHELANSNIVEEIWAEHDMNDQENYGPLPEDQTELYIKKFQAAMIKVFTNNKLNILVATMFSYDSDQIVFQFLFKFVNKYTWTSIIRSDILIEDIQEFLEQNITFEYLDECMQKVLPYNESNNIISSIEVDDRGINSSYDPRVNNLYFVMQDDRMKQVAEYGAREFDIFSIILDNTFDEYFRLISHCIDHDVAKYDVEEEYTDEQLMTYNSVRHIIGNELAHLYILQKNINIDNTPDFLQNVLRLYLIGVVEENVIDKFLENPSEVIFQTIQFQKEMIGTVDISLL